MFYIDARNHSLVNDQASHVLDGIVIKAKGENVYILDATLECLECECCYDVIAELDLNNKTIKMLNDFSHTIDNPLQLLAWLAVCDVELFGYSSTFDGVRVL